MKISTMLALFAVAVVGAQQVLAAAPPPLPDGGATGLLTAVSLGAVVLGKKLIQRRK